MSKEKLNYFVSTNDGREVFLAFEAGRSSMWIPGASKSMVIRRGAGGQQVGAAQFHDTMTSKVDMSLHGRPDVRFKKSLNSATGLGHLEWKSDQEAGVHLAGSAGKGLRLDANGRPLARLSFGGFSSTFQSVMKPLSSSSGGGGGGGGTSSDQIISGAKHYLKALTGKTTDGRLEIYHSGLTREQMEEIVVSGVLEYERRFREKKAGSTAEGFADVADAAGILGDVGGGGGGDGGGGAAVA